MLKKYLKNIWFWLIFTPFIYALIGFLLLPWLGKSQLPPLLKERLGLNLSVEKIAFNPFTFELNIDEITLNDANQSKVIASKHIYINYDVLPIFQKKMYVQSWIIDTPSLNFTIDKEGSFNLIKLFSAVPKSNEQNASTTEESSLDFFIEQIHIINGALAFKDFTPQEPFFINLGPFDYSANNVSFSKDDLSIHALKAMHDNEEKISLASSAIIEPLKFYGELNLKNIHLETLWPYVMQDTKMNLSKGNLFARIPFLIDLGKETPHISIEKANVILEDLTFKDDANKTHINFPKLNVDTINVEWPKAEISIDNITLLKPFVAIEFEKKYQLNLINLFLPTAKKAPVDTNQTAIPPLAFKLKTFNIKEGNIDIIDKNVKAEIINFSALMLNTYNISTDANQSIDYNLSTNIDTTGKLNVSGSFLLSTLSTDTSIQTTELAINIAQPYLEPFTTLTLKEGLLTSQSQFKASFHNTQEPLIQLNSKIDIRKLYIEDKYSKPFLAWDKLLIDNSAYQSTKHSLHVGKIALDSPYINLDINKDTTSNFTGIIKPQPPQKVSSKKEKPLELIMGEIHLKKGTANFKDASLPIPFATYIHNLNGSFSALNTKNTKPSRLLLEGKVEKYGYAKIDGSMLPFDFKNRANVKILLKNIDMSSLTPYSGKFVGYAIKSGKLTLDLLYKIQKGMMVGENKINLDSLILGDKIESEDAVSLPLELAIAILKDSKGQIDLNLPVDGDMNNPDFKYGAIVWKAFGNIIGSILTSPFSLLGSMLGIEAETLNTVEFDAGGYQIIASEEEKMDSYQKILEKKSGLKLIITPSYNEELDTLALQEQEVMKQIELITNGATQDNNYGKALKTLYTKKFSEDAYDNLIKTYKNEKLDWGTIHENLKLHIAQTIVIAPDTLTQLAHQRADVIIQNLIVKHKISPKRILKGELQSSDAIRETWVGCKITISH